MNVRSPDSGQELRGRPEPVISNSEPVQRQAAGARVRDVRTTPTTPAPSLSEVPAGSPPISASQVHTVLHRFHAKGFLPRDARKEQGPVVSQAQAQALGPGGDTAEAACELRQPEPETVGSAGMAAEGLPVT